jgi:transposase InsO family protein
MPGKRIKIQQEKIYMQNRSNSFTQEVSAAKAGISTRSGRSLEKGNRDSKGERSWRTRNDPLAAVWESELKLMLIKSPGLSAITLLEYLQSKYEGEYPDKLLRTLQRRVKNFKSLEGPEKVVMFRQEHPIGLRGLSDFTELKKIEITILGAPLKHILYHFRLAYSGWSYIKVIFGGESYAALAEGLQEALWRLGGTPKEHRTDSLSAAFKNLNADEKKDITDRYQALCSYYQMTATRNNRGESHENGSIESPHGHLKRRIKQALLLRGTHDFDSISTYQNWLDGAVSQYNRRNAKNVTIERDHLRPLPERKTIDYSEVYARVSSSSTVDVRRTTYTVPSRLKGEKLHIHLYHDRLECYLGSVHTITLMRRYSHHKNCRVKQVDYRHVIDSLYKKPQAFRYSQLRDELLPTCDYKKIWAYVNEHLNGKLACKYIVSCLYFSYKYDAEAKIANVVMTSINKNKLISITELQGLFVKSISGNIVVDVRQHSISNYNHLIPTTKGVSDHVQC